MLETLRVLEIGTNIAVPYAGRLLSRLGAQVRVLPAADDPARELPGTRPGALFNFLHAGKIVVMGSPPAQLPERIREADLVLYDPRRAAPEPGPERADALWCTLTLGPHPFPPQADNVVLSALTGMSWAMGEPDRSPLHLPAHTADFLAGLVFAGAALGRWMAGVRGTIEVKAVAALRDFVEQNSTSYRLSGIGWRREGSRAAGCAGIYPYGIYQCRDGQIALIARSAADWASIAMAIDVTDVLTRYPDPFEIALHQADTVDALIGPRLAELSKAEIMQMAENKGVLAAPVNSVADVRGLEHLAAERDLWADFDGRRVPDLPFLVTA